MEVILILNLPAARWERQKGSEPGFPGLKDYQDYHASLRPSVLNAKVDILIDLTYSAASRKITQSVE